MRTAKELKEITENVWEARREMFDKHVRLSIDDICEKQIIAAAHNGEKTVECILPKEILEEGIAYNCKTHMSYTTAELIAEKYLKEELGYCLKALWGLDENGLKADLILRISW